MKIHVLDIPEDAAELSQWLERSLVSMHLGEIAGELSVIHQQHPCAADEITFSEWLGQDRDQVLTTGLKFLPVEKLGQLLARPALLLALQSFVLGHESDYWHRLARASSNSEVTVRVGTLYDRMTSSRSGNPSGPAALQPRDRFSTWRTAYWLPAMAATFLVAVGLYFSRPSPAVEWGWNRPDLLSQRQSPVDYLTTLAAAGNEWFDERPITAEAVVHRIEQMQAGCDRLIASPHPTLSAEDRTWLIERCQAWRGKLNEQLLTLKSGSDAIKARDAVDGVVRQLVEKLRERAVQV